MPKFARTSEELQLAADVDAPLDAVCLRGRWVLTAGSSRSSHREVRLSVKLDVCVLFGPRQVTRALAEAEAEVARL